MQRFQTEMDTIQTVTKQYMQKPITRGLLTTLALELGSMPHVARICAAFGTHKGERPMITLCDKKPSVYLLGWREGDMTDIHDHGNSEVGIFVITGEVTEDIFGCVPAEGEDLKPILRMSRQLSAGSSVTCLAPYIHRMGNVRPEPAATLHVYGPTLKDMLLFSEQKNGDLSIKQRWHNHH